MKAKAVVLSLLVVGVLVFANPLTLAKGIFSRVTKSTQKGNVSSVVTEVRKMSKLKVRKQFVGGFLDVPEVESNWGGDRRHYHVVYQWEGSAEFTIDLAKVVREAVEGDEAIVVLRMPRVEIENLRELPIARPRCVIKVASLGYDEEAEKILGSMPQIVGMKIRSTVDTEENRRKAQKQVEFLLASMVRVTNPNVRVRFNWDE